jgi:hypothetical protein
LTASRQRDGLRRHPRGVGRAPRCSPDHAGSPARRRTRSSLPFHDAELAPLWVIGRSPAQEARRRSHSNHAVKCEPPWGSHSILAGRPFAGRSNRRALLPAGADRCGDRLMPRGCCDRAGPVNSRLRCRRNSEEATALSRLGCPTSAFTAEDAHDDIGGGRAGHAAVPLIGPNAVSWRLRGLASDRSQGIRWPRPRHPLTGRRRRPAGPCRMAERLRGGDSDRRSRQRQAPRRTASTDWTDVYVSVYYRHGCNEDAPGL